jgi:hypothetical protein
MKQADIRHPLSEAGDITHDAVERVAAAMRCSPAISVLCGVTTTG